MKPHSLSRRLHYLHTTERAFVYVFGGLALYVLVAYPVHSVLLLLYGLGVVAYLLYQGQRYWQWKLRHVRGQPVRAAAQLAFFRQAKRVSQWLVGTMPLVCALQWQLLDWQIKAPTQFFLALLANGFGILEYVNYYHYQLMLDTAVDFKYLRRHKKIKVASLAKDLAKRTI